MLSVGLLRRRGCPTRLFAQRKRDNHALPEQKPPRSRKHLGSQLGQAVNPGLSMCYRATRYGGPEEVDALWVYLGYTESLHTTLGACLHVFDFEKLPAIRGISLLLLASRSIREARIIFSMSSSGEVPSGITSAKRSKNSSAIASTRSRASSPSAKR